MLGTGAGPFNEMLSRRILKPVFKNASFICLRDDESKKFTQSIISTPITVSADIVLSETKDYFKSGSIETIGIHVGQVSNQEHLKKIVRYLKEIENRFKLVLVTDSDNVEQSNAANLFSKQINFSSKIQCTSTENFVAELGELDAVVTTKLHVAIVCYAQGVLAISLPAHPKTQRFFSQAAMNEFQFDLSANGIDEAFSFLSCLGSTYGIYSNQIQKRRKELREIALQNKTLLEKFLC
jgi:polysaccharide pyruvyl transferase WcaK-like protein